MLRVGLTGGLGSGKTTIAAMFRACGAHILSADEIGRELMQPGTAVLQEVVRVFGTSILATSGEIDRAALARIAFGQNGQPGRIAELNRIIHPAVIAEEERRATDIFAHDHHAVVIVESALIFEASRGENIPEWHQRFDKLILVTAPEPVKLARFMDRVAAGRSLTSAQHTATEDDGRARMAAQIPDAEKIALCDYVLNNTASIEDTKSTVAHIWSELRRANRL